MLIDSHCHLNFTDAFPDLAETRREMLEAGVDHCLVVGTDRSSSERALELGRIHDWISASAGIHPCTTDFADDQESAWQALATLCADPACAAVGETGLDGHHNNIPLEQQKIRFIRHCDLARQVGKPLIVHCREADDPCHKLLAAHDPGTRGVLHCWAGGRELARAVMDRGWFVSLAGNVTFKNAGDLREAARQIPLDRLLVETDSPFLAPHPHRGKPNRPAWTSLVARCLAELYGVSYDELMTLTRRNTCDLFSLSLP